MSAARKIMSKKSDFGLIGLAVMGQNLVLNVESRGFQVSVYNRTTSVTDEFVAKHPGKKLVGAHTLEEFVQSLAPPRKIHIMVKSTAVKDSDRDAVDAVIEQLIPLLDKGDIVIDGGNSFYQTTERRDCLHGGERPALHRRWRVWRRGRRAQGPCHHARRPCQHLEADEADLRIHRRQGRWRSPVSSTSGPAAPATM